MGLRRYKKEKSRLKRFWDTWEHRLAIIQEVAKSCPKCLITDKSVILAVFEYKKTVLSMIEGMIISKYTNNIQNTPPFSFSTFHCTKLHLFLRPRTRFISNTL